MTISSLYIQSLASQGEGEAEQAGSRIFVPYTLPGETVRAEVDGERATLLEVTTASPDRIAPICRHFGVCGGCALQHANSSVYNSFKRGQISNALGSRGLTSEAGDLFRIPGF